MKTIALVGSTDSESERDAIVHAAVLGRHVSAMTLSALLGHPVRWFCYPAGRNDSASAASVAGLLQVHAAGQLDPGQRVVCTVTGHGLKDPEWAIAGASTSHSIPADTVEAARELGLE